MVKGVESLICADVMDVLLPSSIENFGWIMSYSWYTTKVEEILEFVEFISNLDDRRIMF